MATRLKIALQKSGRLSDDSKQLLKECGISIRNGKNTLVAPSTNFPLDVLYLRDDDIPQYVEDGTADIGILGENVVYEYEREVDVVRQLGFAGCRLSLAVPKGIDYSGVQWFQGKKVATSYPGITRRFLEKHGVSVDIHSISGSVEIAPNIGLADGICDIVSSGSTLFSNGLKEVEKIMHSEAVLIRYRDLSAEKAAVLDQLLFRINSVLAAKNSKYIILNAPNDKVDTIAGLLPGMRSPTVVPLAQAGWSALHSVIAEDAFWEVIDELRAAGAEGILVASIEKMIL